MKTKSGVFLAQAVDLALGAERLVIAALVRLEDAEEEADDLGFLEDVDLDSVDTRELLERLAALAANLSRIVDAYGHAQVRRR